jgi:hypothetical protein
MSAAAPLRPSDGLSTPLYDGPLPPADGQARGAGDAADDEAVKVTIGTPIWRARPLDDGSRDPNVVVVTFACSFRVNRGARVDWARLWVTLSPSGAGGEPAIAQELYPTDIVERRERNVRLALTPALTFKSVEASLGEAVVEFTASELVPVTSAAGLQESSFGWDLQATDEHPVRGARSFAAIVLNPAGGPITVDIELHADARVGRRLLTPLALPRDASRGFVVGG